MEQVQQSASKYEHNGASSTASEQRRTPWSKFSSQRANKNKREQVEQPATTHTPTHKQQIQTITHTPKTTTTTQLQQTASKYQHHGPTPTVTEQIRTQWSKFNSQRANTNTMEQF